MRRLVTVRHARETFFRTRVDPREARGTPGGRPPETGVRVRALRSTQTPRRRPANPSRFPTLTPAPSARVARASPSPSRLPRQKTRAARMGSSWTRRTGWRTRRRWISTWWSGSDPSCCWRTRPSCPWWSCARPPPRGRARTGSLRRRRPRATTRAAFATSWTSTACTSARPAWSGSPTPFGWCTSGATSSSPGTYCGRTFGPRTRRRISPSRVLMGNTSCART